METLIASRGEFKNVDKLVEFYRFFVKKNEEFNLTALTGKEDIYFKHFLDSIVGERFISCGADVVEVGSGGGFPSVPIKIERDDINFTLIEATRKKCLYLEEVKKLSGLRNFDIVNGRCEELSHLPAYREKFDYAVARAVAPLNILAEYLVPFLKVGGKALCYKGAEYAKELDAAMAAIEKLDAKVAEVYCYNLPEGFGSRAIIVIEKLQKTKDCYPRHQSKIRKSPL